MGQSITSGRKYIDARMLEGSRQLNKPFFRPSIRLLLIKITELVFVISSCSQYVLQSVINAKPMQTLVMRDKKFFVLSFISRRLSEPLL